MMYYVLALVSATGLVGEKWLQNLLYVSSAGREGFGLTLSLQQKFVVLAVGKKIHREKKKPLKKCLSAVS